jgi:Flp pilus assembly pilin Flp
MKPKKVTVQSGASTAKAVGFFHCSSKILDFGVVAMNSKKCNQQRGQGMMEYIIIVALIAIAAIGIYSAFGKTARNQTAGIALELSGNKADTTKAQTSANAAAGRANDPLKEGMGQYNYANDAK